MDSTTDFPGLFREFQGHIGPTRAQFAQEVDVSLSSINVCEKGTPPPLTFLRRWLLQMAKKAGLIKAPVLPTRPRKGVR